MRFPEKEEYKLKIEDYEREFSRFMPLTVSKLLIDFEDYCANLKTLSDEGRIEIFELGKKYCDEKKKVYQRGESRWLIDFYFIRSPQIYGRYNRKRVKITGDLEGLSNVKYLETNESEWVEPSEIMNIEYVFPEFKDFPEYPFKNIKDKELQVYFYFSITAIESDKFSNGRDYKEGEREDAYLEWWNLMYDKHHYAEKYISRQSDSKDYDEAEDITDEQNDVEILSALEKVQLIEEIRKKPFIKNYEEAIEEATKEANQHLYKDYQSFKKARHYLKDYL